MTVEQLELEILEAKRLIERNQAILKINEQAVIQQNEIAELKTKLEATNGN